MVKSADTADLKSADRKRSWGFKSPSGHHDGLVAVILADDAGGGGGSGRAGHRDPVVE